MTLLPATTHACGAQSRAAPPAEEGAGAFSARVRERFGRRAADYDGHARLQRAIAWRLAGHARCLPLPAGPLADLGAGSGLLSRALLERRADLAARPPLQLDHCPELLARNPFTAPPFGRCLPFCDLNQPLPPPLSDAALLASSFALQWLEQPAVILAHWCERLTAGGWLLLALPVAGSFSAWRQAAAAAAVPFTGLELPQAEGLVCVAEERLALQRVERLSFRLPRQDGLATLRQFGALGASASRRPPLGTGQLRRLLRHWPPQAPLNWQVLLLVGRRLP